MSNPSLAWSEANVFKCKVMIMMTTGEYFHINHFLKVHKASRLLLQTFTADPDEYFKFVSSL